MKRQLISAVLALGLCSPARGQLTTSLESYWKLDEASGNALDADGSNAMTETSGTIGTTTGKINGARDFEDADTEYFVITDNASLSTGDIDFTLAAWVQFESEQAFGAPWGKYASGQSEYQLFYQSATDRFVFRVSSDGSNNTDATSNNFGATSVGVWYYIVCWHDATANTINIQINNTTANSVAHTTGVFNSTSSFGLGARGDASLPWDGLIDEAGFWKRVLTTDERTSLYNGGAGLAYPFASTAKPHIWYYHSAALRRLFAPRHPLALNPVWFAR